jgi:hypothetical protein
MDNARAVNRIKNYLLVRWRTRRQTVAVSGVVAFFAVLTSLTIRHDGKAIRIVVFFACFDLIAVLWPFRFSGEDWK